MLLFSAKLTPTKEEVLDGLHRSGLRRASKERLIIQTVLLGVVAVWQLIGFFGSGMTEWMSLFITMIALVIIPVMWFVPEWQMKQMAKEAAESDNRLTMWVFDDGIDFGKEQPDCAYYAYGRFQVFYPKETTTQTVVLRFKNDDVVVVPQSSLTEDEWKTMITAMKRRPFGGAE